MTPKQLRDWRKKHEVSQTALAELLGVHKMTVSKWERDAQPIPGFLALALSELARQLSAEEESQDP